MICDIAKYQGKIDWEKFSTVLDCVWIKASGKYENNGDPRYFENVTGAVRYKIPFHVYHFLYCLTEKEAKRDAGLFYSKVKEAGYEPITWCLDCEAAWGISDDKAPMIAKAFEDELRRLAGNDIRVGIYVAHQKYKDWKMDYDHYDYVWIPRYGKGDKNDGILEHSTKPDHPCDLWQFTSKGKAPGIDPEILDENGLDVSVLNGSKPLSYFTTRHPGKEEPKESVVEEGFTGKGLAKFALDVYESGNWVYWYGTYGNKCSESLYNSKKNQYPSHYTSDRTSGYQKDIQNGRWCADCVGLIKAYFWKNGDINATPKYGSNNCPDKSADGMINYCSQTGSISSIPDEPGLVVWKSGHIGVYVGNGYTVELKGFDYDCKKVKVKDGPWTKWGRLPKSMVSYAGEPVAPGVPSEPEKPVEDILKKGSKGSKGSAVKEMQKLLLKWNSACLPKYGADGDFGSETEKALKKFQESQNIPVTGVYDATTKTSLENYKPEEQPPSSYDAGSYIEVTGNYVNVRKEPNTDCTVLGVVRKYDRYKFLGKVTNLKWYNIDYRGTSAWISGAYSKIVR